MSRSFSAETKLAVVKRMLCGEEVRALTEELNVSRAFICRWKKSLPEAWRWRVSVTTRSSAEEGWHQLHKGKDPTDTDITELVDGVEKLTKTLF
jgi:hypothetical protein